MAQTNPPDVLADSGNTCRLPGEFPQVVPFELGPPEVHGGCRLCQSPEPGQQCQRRPQTICEKLNRG